MSNRYVHKKDFSYRVVRLLNEIILTSKERVGKHHRIIE